MDKRERKELQEKIEQVIKTRNDTVYHYERLNIHFTVSDFYMMDNFAERNKEVILVIDIIGNNISLDTIDKIRGKSFNELLPTKRGEKRAGE